SCGWSCRRHSFPTRRSSDLVPGIRKYVSVDGGMTDNLRPALYQARYEAMLANRALEDPTETVTIAGKCCESGDVLIWDLKLPPVDRKSTRLNSSHVKNSYAV